MHIVNFRCADLDICKLDPQTVLKSLGGSGKQRSSSARQAGSMSRDDVISENRMLREELSQRANENVALRQRILEMGGDLEVVCNENSPSKYRRHLTERNKSVLEKQHPVSSAPGSIDSVCSDSGLGERGSGLNNPESPQPWGKNSGPSMEELSLDLSGLTDRSEVRERPPSTYGVFPCLNNVCLYSTDRTGSTVSSHHQNHLVPSRPHRDLDSLSEISIFTPERKTRSLPMAHDVPTQDELRIDLSRLDSPTPPICTLSENDASSAFLSNGELCGNYSTLIPGCMSPIRQVAGDYPSTPSSADYTSHLDTMGLSSPLCRQSRLTSPRADPADGAVTPPSSYDPPSPSELRLDLSSLSNVSLLSVRGSPDGGNIEPLSGYDPPTPEDLRLDLSRSANMSATLKPTYRLLSQNVRQMAVSRRDPRHNTPHQTKPSTHHSRVPNTPQNKGPENLDFLKVCGAVTLSRPTTASKTPTSACRGSNIKKARPKSAMDLHMSAAMSNAGKKKNTAVNLTKSSYDVCKDSGSKSSLIPKRETNSSNRDLHNRKTPLTPSRVGLIDGSSAYKKMITGAKTCVKGKGHPA